MPSSAAATLQRPSYDFKPLTTLTLDPTNAKRTATVAQAVGKVLSDTVVESTDDFLDACAAKVDRKAFSKTLTLRKGLQVYEQLGNLSKQKSRVSSIERYGKEFTGDNCQRLRKGKSCGKRSSSTRKELQQGHSKKSNQD